MSSQAAAFQFPYPRHAGFWTNYVHEARGDYVLSAIYFDNPLVELDPIGDMPRVQTVYPLRQQDVIIGTFPVRQPDALPGTNPPLIMRIDPSRVEHSDTICQIRMAVGTGGDAPAVGTFVESHARDAGVLYVVSPKEPSRIPFSQVMYPSGATHTISRLDFMARTPLADGSVLLYAVRDSLRMAAVLGPGSVRLDERATCVWRTAMTHLHNSIARVWLFLTAGASRPPVLQDFRRIAGFSHAPDRLSHPNLRAIFDGHFLARAATTAGREARGEETLARLQDDATALPAAAREREAVSAMLSLQGSAAAGVKRGADGVARC
jgi:hypothetical protein